jgi:TM2 domain-containing membrane protein YozV
MNIDESL